MTEPMSVLHLTGKDPSTGQIKTFDFEIVDEVARRQKADKADTVQETTLSRGRKEGTEVGEASVAFGTDVEASGEGSHAEGNGTIANAPYMYAFGEYNTPAEVLPEWVAETEYSTGDKVIYDGKAYVCDTANSDAEFDPAKWTETEMPEAPVFVIGNGTSENSRGDAFAVERDGDVKAGGDLYTNYDPATGTGKKVATEDYVGDLIGDVVSMEYAVADELPATGEVGTIYLIPNGETSGTDTHDEYIWVPATESFEKIGNTKVDLSDYALKTDTVLNTTLSMGRKAGTTVGQNSVALGNDVTASNGLSFAEGSVTTASGLASHAEGINTTASGTGAHAEGKDTTASKEYAHAEGLNTTAAGYASHAEGNNTQALGAYSHVQGKFNVPDSSGDAAFIIGNGTDNNHRSNAVLVKWDGSVQISMGSKASNGSIALGAGNTATGTSSFASGSGTTASGNQSHAEGMGSQAKGDQSHAEGAGTGASGNQSHAEGGGTSASGAQSHAEGAGTGASGNQSHAEGSSTKATSDAAHAEGQVTNATGGAAHAEGFSTYATAFASHAEGNQTTAAASFAHAEGNFNHATGWASHAEGDNSDADGRSSHAEGNHTCANGSNMHAQGIYNKLDDTIWANWIAKTSYAVGDKVTYDGEGYICETANSDATFVGSKWTNAHRNGDVAFVIGNGSTNDNRSNALTVNWDGTQKIAGDLYTNYNFDTNTGNKVATEAYVTEAIAGAGGGESDEYALKTDTVLNTTLSLGRKADTTVGQKSTALGYNVTASGDLSFATGNATTASGQFSHAEGMNTIASGLQSHAEGYGTSATDTSAHAEGANSTASGYASHAEGSSSQATGGFSHAEGQSTTASGMQSHAEGGGTLASGGQSHAEGGSTTASGNNSHAEGSGTIANGVDMHAQGKFNKPDDAVYPDWVANKSYVVGDKVTYQGDGYTCKTANSDATFNGSKWTRETTNGGKIAFVIGNGTGKNNRSNAFAVKWDGSVQEGAGTTASGNQSHAEGGGTTASAAQAHAEGGGSQATGGQSHAEGNGSRATGGASHAEGAGTQATGYASHAEGGGTTASGPQAHAEGGNTHATKDNSHAEGGGTTASGLQAHAEGNGTTASGQNSHAEGYNAQATGIASHAEGSGKAIGDYSHAEGAGTQADGYCMHVQGKFNAPDSSGETAFIIGNGTANDARSNAFAVKWDGTTKAAGDIYANDSKKVATEEYVNTAVAGAGGGSDEYALKTDTVLNTTLSMGRKAETVVGENSTALGYNVTASGKDSHAEGRSTTASGNRSHAEGGSALATGDYSHAECSATIASGNCSHAEGNNAQASGAGAHAEGNNTTASGGGAHAEGGSTQATGTASHAEGGSAHATGGNSHAEGYRTIANGFAMHAQGKYNKPDDAVWPDWVSGKSYAVGDKVTYQGSGYTCKTANSDATFTSRNWTYETANGGEVAFVIGNGTADDARSNTFAVKWDGTTTAAGDVYANNTKKLATEEYVNNAVSGGGGSDEYALKTDTVLNTTLSMGRKAETVVGQNSTALGYWVTASGYSSHAEGAGTQATGGVSHAEGSGTQATGNQSHAEGSNTQATGEQSHAEGYRTTASGINAHAEGASTTASGSNAHAEGGSTTASGAQSHAEGSGTIANGTSMHAQGKYNKPDDTVWPDWEAGKSYVVGDKVTYQGYGYTCKTANSDATFTSSNWTLVYSNGDVAFVIGNGTGENARSNAFAVKWDGTLIMRDVSNGAYYKVYIDGGVLKTEAVV